MRPRKERSRPGAPSSRKHKPIVSSSKTPRDIKRAAIEDGISDIEPYSTGPFPIVGIGASAGGLEAFRQLLQHLPAKTGMAFVLVQHLDPRHKTQLPELLSHATTMSVAEVNDGVAVKPDHVYVIAPNTNMALLQGSLRLTPRDVTHTLHLPIDHFFQSLAKEQQSLAIGVVLSGTGSDGTQGLAEIKGMGGITFAQEERSAKFPAMALSAIQNGCVDFILPPEAIARELAKIGRHPYMAPVLSEREPLPTEEEQFKKILALLRSVVRVDFFQYRDTTIKRRIMRRMLVHTKLTLAEYVRHLQEHPEEVEALYHDILINVTSFFRDPGVFEALKRAVFPEIMKSKPSTIRIWAPGCSTGQEAYSLAIALTEYLEDQPVRPSFHVFATDLSESGSLEKGRAGIYPENIEGQMSPERLRRFFRKEDGGYRIIKSIRDSCVFARQNVAVDPPFSRLDLISCRNVLIYFAPSLQQRILSTFYYALNPDAFLVLGSSEAVGRGAAMFTLADNRHKIYVKKTGAVQSHRFVSSADVAQTFRDVRSTSQPAPTTSDFEREADRIALGRYAPASVLINENLEILQFRGRTGPYLEPPSGEASFNVLKMARENLALDLGEAIREAKRRNAPVRRQRIRVGSGRRAPEVNLEVIPLKPFNSAGRCLLICFEDARRSAKTPTAPPPARGPLRTASRSGREAHLQRELSEAKEFLQGLVEQHDAAMEELKSANEEILSGNEELQSANEELETAKEELQSGNEELTTLNEELQSRNAELTQLNDDLSNLLASARIPIVMVGPDLRIRRFNAAAGKVLGLHDTDVNRLIGHVKLAAEIPNLERLLWQAIDDVTVKEQELQDQTGHWYSLRINPYRTGDNKIHGAVIVLIDIDDAKHAQLRLQALQTYTQAIVDTVRGPLVILESDLRVKTANRAFYQIFQTIPRETEGRHFFDLGNHQWNVPKVGPQLESLLSKNTAIENLEVTCAFPHLGLRTMTVDARLLVQEESERPLVLLAIDDITESRRGQAALKQAEEHIRTSLKEKEVLLKEIHHRVKNNLQIISSLLNFRTDDIQDPKILKLLKDSQDRIRAMALVHEKLYQSKDLAQVDMKSYIQSLTDSLLHSYGIDTNRIATNMQIENGLLSIDSAMPCGLILNELLCNALTHAFPNGRSGEVMIRLQNKGQGRLILTVRDNGVGIPEDLDVLQAESLGLKIVKALTEQLQGALRLDRRNGTAFLITLSDGPEELDRNAPAQ